MRNINNLSTSDLALYINLEKKIEISVTVPQQGFPFPLFIFTFFFLI